MREIRQITVRFNLDNELHKRVWMCLHNMDRKQYKSYSNIVVEAVDAYFSKNDDNSGIDEKWIAGIVRDTVQECFTAVLSSEILKSIFTENTPISKPASQPIIPEKINDIDWNFLGGKIPDIET